MSDGTRSSNQTLRLIIAWTVVGVPALWGVSQVIQKSLALFR